MSRYPVRSDVTVTGGPLAVYTWEAPGGAPTLVALHGVTSSHAAWAWLADALPGVRVVAPDLRGRGRSRDLGAPYGLAAHADDVARLVDSLGGGPQLVLGHSMGAFVSVVLAHRHPGLVRELVLVDGGLPLEVPDGADPDETMRVILGPAAERLTQTYATPAQYRDFWRTHPVFGSVEDPRFDAYSDHDLAARPDGLLEPATRVEALFGDQAEIVGGNTLLPAVNAPGTETIPTTFVHSPRGLLDGAPMYSPAQVRRRAEDVPGLRVVWSEDSNHYTVVMSDAGAAEIAAVLVPLLEAVPR
ncbi:MAG: alpha/beta fold hydrolase [Actinomycetaceae bacterium]